MTALCLGGLHKTPYPAFGQLQEKAVIVVGTKAGKLSAPLPEGRFANRPNKPSARGAAPRNPCPLPWGEGVRQGADG
jgi:hypothetical protein